ncbi:hypothetical protein CAEBREN_13684 [Caenorhabditis brenneri]|uniref:CCHC-type domain-containing protein n=1 Tax=Caenorhabditis brenneri TaxID=135651 RepID=G0N871_CAEBE|nr:hypothetical protein CAEBREN_13684 [Caenorhabditis brenneri]
MEGFPQDETRRDQPPGDPRRDRPRYNFNDNHYPPYNPHQPAPPSSRHQPPYTGYSDGGYQENHYRNYQEEQRRQQERLQKQQEEQRRREAEEHYQNIKPDFKTMRDQIANAQKQCSELHLNFDKFLENRNVILAPVYENFKENHRKLQDFYFEAQDELIRYKTYVSLFEGAAKSLLFMIQHKLIRHQKVDKHLSKKGVHIPEQRGDHGVLIRKMDTLLDECRQAMDRLMKSWAEEREKPQLTEIYDGDAIIELAEDEDSEVVVEQKVSQAVVADEEVAELKKEVAGMKISMDEMKENMSEMKELLKLAIQQSSATAEVQVGPPETVVSGVENSQEREEEFIWSTLGVVLGRNVENSRARQRIREESSQNGKHHRDWSDELEEEGSRYNGRGYEEGPRRRDQEDGLGPHDDQYDIPRTTEVDRRDYDSRRHGYEHSRERPFSHGSRRTQSPRRRHQDERAHDDSGHRDERAHQEYDRRTDHYDQSPVRSSRSRNDGWSPEHRHHNDGSRNGYSGRDSGPSQDRDYRRHSSRESSFSHSRGYPSGNQVWYGALEEDIPGGHPPSNNGPSKKHQQNSRGKQQEGSKARRQRKPEGIVCYRCKKPGHHKNQCVETKCGNCGGFGHAEDVCTSKTGRN